MFGVGDMLFSVKDEDILLILDVSHLDSSVYVTSLREDHDEEDIIGVQVEFCELGEKYLPIFPAKFQRELFSSDVHDDTKVLVSDSRSVREMFFSDGMVDKVFGDEYKKYIYCVILNGALLPLFEADDEDEFNF